MYIAVLQYKGSTLLTETDNVAVLDTLDGSIELVQAGRLYNSGVDVKHFYKSLTPYEYNVTSSDLMTSKNLTRGYIQVYKDFLYLGDFRVKIETGITGLKVFGVTLAQKYLWSLSYVFRFQDYIILRFTTVIESKRRWLSVAVQSIGIISYWTSDFSFVLDKATALRVDMLSEV